ncbi:Metallophosphoesterase OS=Tsukamurella paurometabola (strain ATCC 8368 / DSM / CCUG 35730 /CIP 100753 / JCM 10117 / KCTC 9821 / NBRC 16120 / NCIMB 702349/ NCTC 13040) OX=521096 GN=Tpau_1203 PE=4 SV=1 [Tsukamurella paurometabola]|uniref:Metallophosphoesterase n=1 Tax=Tsukamurella paurometabola (strain ATCC 8368 / DSM 20162 / CCUG 35730 / CIP 100753 / JCM 10117 / KCTC 9821 / NBRC 16120 / NCIMB 702349 / NCTC 13040) TaxID=521096 RepID=D5UW27_TSUPD|nr:metallophosphoesterase [Tsukamurella paurometabola]ADG77834.1 metallophosphoesterase [Tsukamurella paurometabola DSM 20162]SUP28949.1 Calcineurin-like phosphoesterase [Tsukamurella paurometabola]
MRVLAVSDEEVPGLTLASTTLRPDLILGAGDLPGAYLESLMDRYGVPCVFVPGNHDPDHGGFRRTRGGYLRGGLPAEPPGPRGGVNADGRVVTVAGLTVAGLGGSIRYHDGANQWTQGQLARRAWRLRQAARLGRRTVDVVLTHSPAAGVGDGDDSPHRGFTALGTLVSRLRPQVFVHGHVHPHGRPGPDLTIGAVPVLNTVGYTYFDITPGDPGAYTIRERRRGA